MIDPGPSYFFRAPVIPPEGPRPGTASQATSSMAGSTSFCDAKHAIHSKETLDGNLYDKLYLTIDGFTISLLSYTGEERPYRVIRQQRAKARASGRLRLLQAGPGSTNDPLRASKEYSDCRYMCAMKKLVPLPGEMYFTLTGFPVQFISYE